MQQRLCLRPTARLYKAFLGPNANANAWVLSTHGLEMTIQISMLDVRNYVTNMSSTECEIKPAFILAGRGRGQNVGSLCSRIYCDSLTATLFTVCAK